MNFFTACCYCKRETVNGMAIGAPLLIEKYKLASHGHCLDCGADFEAGFSTEAIMSRAANRRINSAYSSQVNQRLQESGLHLNTVSVRHEAKGNS